MKKFFVGLLSVFVLFGATILTACTNNNVQMTLSAEYIEIQIRDESVSPTAEVTVTVTGTSDSQVSVDARDSSDILSFRTQTLSDGRTTISITGQAEGSGQIYVTSYQGNITKVINVDVYSEVSGMEQKIEEEAKKNIFAVRGGSVELIDTNLITFSPSQNSRRTITWSLLDGTQNATIDNNILTIEQSYSQESIFVVATTEKGVTCTLELPVIDKLEDDLTLSWSYSRDNQEYEAITEEDNTFTIVPNVAGDEWYTGYVKLNFSQDLEVTYRVVDSFGNLTDELIVESTGNDNDGNPIYAIYTNKNITSLNEDFKVYFEVGYASYNMQTVESLPINIQVREKVNGIVISTSEIDNIEGTTQVLYSSYSNSYGREYFVEVTPTTVVGATGRYSISVRITNPLLPEGGLSSGCPVEFWYQDTLNNNHWTQALLEYDEQQEIYLTRDENMLSANRIYMKAASDLNAQNFAGIEITFRSADNTDVTNVFYAQLVKSVSSEDFVFEDADFSVDSSSNSTSTNVTKYFTLQGQTTIDGLYIKNYSENVTLPLYPSYISSTDTSVTFAITLTLNRSSYGVTSLDYYQICHENGLESEMFEINIFLPLNDVAILYDTSNLSASVTDYTTNNLSYDISGNIIQGNRESLARMMLKNGTTTPILYSFNSSGQYQAQADIDVSYYDFVESDTMTLEMFKALINSRQGIEQIILGSRANTERISAVAHFSADNNSIITNGVGFTYAVVTFTGSGVDGEVTIVKIILIESYVAPDGMNITPSSDRQVNLYSADSVASRDEALTKKTITINFTNTGITYKTINNFEFVSTMKDASGNLLMGQVSKNKDSVTWENGRYALEIVAITDSSLTFTISTISNYGDFTFFDELEIHYQLIIDGEDGQEIMDVMWTTINITIRNAQRVTSLDWENSDENGIYFEIGDDEPYYLVLTTSPSTARNNNITYIITDQNGTVTDSSTIVNVEDIASGTLGVSLSDRITQGTTGYVYLLPEDAIYNGNIIYNYYSGEEIVQGQISERALGLLRSDGQTWYDFLVGNAFFMSNTSLNTEAEQINFSDILLKIKITVADGSSFDYAFRIYDENTFNGILPNLYYTVMNSLDISAERTAIDEFSGGLQGNDESIIVNFNGSNFANIITENATIRNIGFSGTVNGQGFVANANNGIIDNVTIDVYQTYSSKLEFTGTGFVGGIVGINDGTITNSSVLGLTINASLATVGGIAGQNNAIISYSRVEFYNLDDRDSDGTLYSTFTGDVVGGLVGQSLEISSIEYSYAYNYNIGNYTNSNISVISGTTVGAIVGQITGQTRIYYSFAVIDNVANYVGNAFADVTTNSDFYWSYYLAGEYTSSYYNENSSNLISSGDGFYTYVNNGNAHFRDLYQEEKVTDVRGTSVQTYEENGFYKSLAVSQNSGILFYYGVERGSADLSSSATNDLNELNTISLSQLLNRDVTDNIIITSSNNSVVRTIGSSIIVVGTGDVTLTISSKHDVTNEKPISVKVMYALSQMIISYTDNANNTYQIQEGSVTYLQKTKSRQYTVTYENSTVILGNTAERYTLLSNDVTLQMTPDVENSIDITPINNIFIVTTNNNSVQTTLNVEPIVTNDEYQSAINDEFRRTFTISPVDGVISFYYTGESLPLTPSTNAALRVEVDTTAESDSENLRPIISYNGYELHIVKDENLSQNDITVYHYTLPQDYQTDPDDYILTTTVTLLNRDTAYNSSTGLYSYLFEISFSVDVNYRSKIDSDMDFMVTFRSNSEIDSGDIANGSSGQVVIHLTRQNFTNIDVTSFKVERSRWTNDDGVYRTVHERGEQTSVVTPGSNSILQITANPYFAHYDYMELSYSNATIANAVTFELVRQYNNTNNFIQYADANVNNYADTIRFTPDRSTGDDFGTLYFRVAISSQVDSDSTIRFTASFFTSEGTLLSRVNYYLTINYLAEPIVLIDGESQAYLALGSSATVEIQVRQDQVVDSATLEGERISGVYISSLSEPPTDPITGIKTYTATVTAGVNASVESANNNLSIRVRVTRTLNGVQEARYYYATITLVDIKLDTDATQIVGAENGNLDIWLGVGQQLEVEYSVLPESYNYDHNDPTSVAKVSELLAKRQEFLVNQYHVSRKMVTDEITSETTDLIQYAINYNINESRPYTLSERLFYVINGNEEIPVTDDYKNSAGARFEFTTNENGTQEASIIGARQNATVQFRLKTYVYTNNNSNGLPMSYDTDFTVTVGVYSDKDLPISITSATDFENLNPDNYTGSVTQEDYILMNDIVLDNHTPFNTNLISSLDGNGYTIYIKSFNQTSSSNVLNLALFNNVLESTTLKNVRVNIYNGGQLTIDLASLSSNVQINIAGLAISNAGTITNSEVVSFYTDGTAVGRSENLLEPATTAHNNPSGFNVKFIRGANTTENIYITQGSSWTPRIAGFVITNTGNITNSRVGGDSVTILGEDRSTIGSDGSVIAMGYTYASTQTLDTFYMIGQGDMAGFVLVNSGTVSSSFVKRLDMENQSNSTDYDTSGFAGENSGMILTSYVEGEKDEASTEEWAKYAYTGTSLKSAYGIIAGFINNNTGTIKNSYSNILISNSSNALRVYLASGFVYQNSGTIETSYSASQIVNSRSTQMNFSGVNESGDLLVNGTYTNCYYFRSDYYGNEGAIDSSNEALYNTGAMLIPNPEMSTYFYGFAIADSENDGVWSISQEEGIKLIEPNIIAHSHRYVSYLLGGAEVDGVVGTDEQGQYVLPYAILQFTDSTREINTSLGSTSNPILIADAQDFVEAMGNSSSSYTSQYYNSYSIWGTYRLVGDIDLSDLSTSIVLPSVSRAFSGRLYANGFTISNLSIASEGSGVSYGLFSSLESRNGSSPIISNLNLTINQVVAGDVALVGGLAGYAKDSILVGIDITFNSDAQVNGLNFVGGLTGLSFGNSVIKNITVTNPNVIADRYDSNAFFTTEGIRTIRNDIRNNLNNSTVVSSALIRTLNNYSYAGSVVGYVDHFVNQLNEFNVNMAEDYTINNIRVSGTVYVQGQVAGGLFGLTAYQTNVRDAGITITAGSDNTESHIIATKYFAGGAFGQTFGGLSRIFAVYDETTQGNIENNMSNFYTGDTSAERGATNLFYLDNSTYNQQYVGGLIGYVESGRLEVSYSKLNVVSMSADFAGGIVGGINLNNANTYLATSELLSEQDNVYTKYFINEVYATGDVRAKQDGQSGIATAGGIIGASYGTNNRVALLAVNAYNYISNYNYLTQQDITFNTSTNASEMLKTNLILGSTFVATGDEDTTWEYQSIDATNYTNYINFVQLTSEGEGSEEDVVSPTVSFYESYTFNGNIINFNVFGTQNSINNSDNDLFTNNAVYAISSPINYTSSTVGHSSTQQGFLSSGVWVSDNWTHPSEELFPSIQYQRTNNVIYLDNYEDSIVHAFDLMQSSSSDVTIVVRGLPYEGAPEIEGEYEDVDLNPYLQNNTISAISGFSGSLIGHTNTYTKYVDGEEEPIRIIADRSFIESVGPGFYLDDVVIEYTGTAVNGDTIISIDSDNGSAGLFSQGELDEATITNLDIYVDAPVNVSVNAGSSNINVGLLAPRLINSTLANVSINASNSNISSTDFLLDVDFHTNATSISQDSLSVGLIAGSMTQSSTSSIMRVDGLNMIFSSHLINLNGFAYNRDENSFVNTHFDNMYVGGYFGQVYKESSALEMRLNLQTITRDEPGSQRIIVSDISATNAYIAGYVGLNNGLDTLSTADNFSSNIDIYLDDSSSQATTSFETLYTGIIFGKAQNTTINRINLNASFNGGLYVVQNAGENASNVTIDNLYAGGFSGKLESEMRISNLYALNYEIVSIDSINKPYDVNTLHVGTAKVGVVVGSTSAYFSMSGGSADITTLNEHGESIRLSGLTQNSAIGSVLGETTATTSSQGSATLQITCGIVSFAQFVVVGADDTTDDITVGGLIGLINHDTTSVDNSMVRVEIGSIGSTFTSAFKSFNGAVYSNIENLTFGGIVGETAFSHSSDVLYLYNTSFGGALKIFGGQSENAKVYAGGSIGSIESNQSSTPTIVITNSFNYGDVFVEYDKSSTTINQGERFTTLNQYVFGGLIARIDANYDLTISNNYSMVTSHNSRFTSDNNSFNNALFGESLGENAIYSNNYYSSVVALSTDEYGIDIGYNTAYRQNGIGFGSTSLSMDDTNNVYLSMIGTYERIESLLDNRNVELGHKLNPSVLDNTSGNVTTQSTIIPNDLAVFNGMSYVVFSQDTSDTNYIKPFRLGNDEGKEITNIALIGNANEISYTIDDNSAVKASLIDSLRGYSYVSGLVVNVDITTNPISASGDSNELEDRYAGLVNNMYDSSYIYAVQVKGRMDIGNDKVTNVGGLVVNLYSGRIEHATTSLDIIYRGANKINETSRTIDVDVYGLAGLANEYNNNTKTYNIDLNKFVINSYTTGSIESYISANLYAFTKVPTSASATYNIEYCYSITKLDLNDYTISGDATGILSVFGVSSSTENRTKKLTNSYYDYNAINAVVSEDSIESNNNYRINTSSLSGIATSGNAYLNYYDEGELDFNYGYPATRFGFMKTSSYATATTETKGTGYDSFVSESTYTRLANFTRPSDYETAYYIVPNAGVLAKTSGMSFTQNVESTATIVYIRNFALWYDIDLTNTQYSNGWESLNFTTVENIKDENDSSNTIDTYISIDFDGREKTILGLRNSLFGTIDTSADIENNPTSRVRNLRLTEADISNSGLLAKVLYNTDVSNITLSGSITDADIGIFADDINENPDNIFDSFKEWLEGIFGTGEEINYLAVGALANEVRSSTISTVTNMTTINVADFGTGYNILAVGGIVGTMFDSTINYSSNYGPINVATLGNDATQNYYVGGIAGFISSIKDENTIDYSYNATSVMAGYINSSTLLTNLGTYYVGGVAGYSNAEALTINGSYNSGTIKSGNKANGKTVNGAIQGSSHGGGIIAYATNANLTSCYNEGTIEALGASPVTSFSWDGNSNLVLTQTNARNVWAYAMGYVRDSASYNSISVADASEESVYMNGSMLEAGTEINTWAWSEISNYVETSSANMHGELEHSDVRINFIPNYVGHAIYKSTLDITTTLNRPTADDTPVIYVNSYNSFGLPQSFIIQLSINTKITFAESSGDDYRLYWGIPLDLFNLIFNVGMTTTEENITNDEFAHISYEDVYEDYLTSYTDQSNNFISNNIVSNISTNGSTIKSNTRSESTSTDNKNVQIGGTTYYIADENNLRSIFSAGIYTYEVEAELGELPYIANTSYYSVTATGATASGSTDLSTYITGINQNTLSFVCYSSEELTGSISYTINFNYDVELNFNTSNLKYYYVDDYSIGIEVGAISNLQPIGGYILRAQNGMNYSRVVKAVLLSDGITIDQLNKMYPEVVSDDDFDQTAVLPEDVEEVLYFAINNNILVYIPNAELSNGRQSITVNSSDIELNGGANFSENVQTIINEKFSDKTYYCSVAGTSERIKEINFVGLKGSGSGSLSNASGSSNGGTVIDYGTQVEEQWYSNDETEIYTSNIEIDIENSFTLTGDITRYDIQYNGRTIAVYNGQWASGAVTSDTITLDGVSYTFTIVPDNGNGRLVLNFTIPNIKQEDEVTFQTDIISYIEDNFTFINNTDGRGNAEDYVSLSAGSTSRVVSGYAIPLNILLNTYSEALALYGEEPIFSYHNYTWSDGDLTDLFIVETGQTYNISVNNNNLIVVTQDSFESVTQYFLSRIQIIANKLDNRVELDDLFETIENERTQTVYITDEGEEIGYMVLTLAKVNEFISQTTSAEIVNIDGVDYAIINEDDLSSLTSKTLNGVTIYFGQLNVGYVQTYTTSVTNISISISNGKLKNGNSVIYEVWGGVDYSYSHAFTKNNNDIEGYYTTSFSPFNFELTSDENDFYIRLYSGYAMSEDDLDELTLVLHDTEVNATIKDFVYTATVDVNNRALSNERIYYSAGGVLVSFNYTDVETEPGTDENILNSSGFYFYDQNNNPIFSYSYARGNGEGSEPQETYTIYYDRNGSNLTTEGEVEGEIIYGSVVDLSNVRVVYTSTKEQINIDDLISSVTGQPHISEDAIHYSGRNDTNYMVKTEQIASNYFILVNDRYEVQTSIELGDNISKEFTTSINATGYAWESYKFSEYRQQTINTDIFKDDVVVNNKFDIDFTILSTTDGNSYTIPSYTINKIFMQHYNNDRLAYSLLLRPDTNPIITLSISVLKEYNSIGPITQDNIVTNEPAEPHSIILMNDISFRNDYIEGGGFIKQQNVNIIGNGYYISYYGSPFFKSLLGTESYVKDVSFLGENNDTLLLKKAQTNGFDNLISGFQSDLYDIKLYGSVSNFNESYGALIDFNGTFEGDTIDLTNYVAITTDINVNNNNTNRNSHSASNKKLSDLTLISGVENSNYPLLFTNYGFISASNGLDGENGISANNVDGTVTDGDNGENGYSVVISTNMLLSSVTEGEDTTYPNYSNSGFIKTGDGGNGGAGGSSYRAEEDIDTFVGSGSLPTPLEAGKGGVGGEQGYIKFNSDVNTYSSRYAQNGISGLNGARGRYGLTRVQLTSQTKVYSTFVIGETNWNDYDTARIQQNGGTPYTIKKDVYSSMFNSASDYYKLEGTYAVQFPSITWTGSNYDEIKDNANAS